MVCQTRFEASQVRAARLIEQNQCQSPPMRAILCGKCQEVRQVAILPRLSEFQ